MRKVALVGAGVSKFGVRKASYRDLIWEAGKACFDSIPAVKPKDLDGLVVGSVMPERTRSRATSRRWPPRRSVSGRARSARGPSTCAPPAPSASATPTRSSRPAWPICVMVLGVEKLNQPTGDEAILNMGTGVDREWEAAFGLTAPPCFALAAQRAHGRVRHDRGAAGARGREEPHPRVQEPQRPLQQGRDARPGALLADDLDPAAPLHVLADHRRRGRRGARVRGARRDLTDKPVWIRGTGQALDGFQLTSLHEDYAHWPALERAAQSAYAMAGVTPADVDVAEVHDCFAIAEMIAYEELGFCAKGEAGPFAAAGRSDYGGDVVVNPRGGLIGCGHPLGATGVAQAAEVFAQLRDEAGARQVPDAAIGLTHNNSGMGEHVVMIYGKERVLGDVERA